MNDRDKKNLEFIMSLKTQEEWEEWADSVDEDDLLYALVLVRTAMSEAETQKMNLEEQIQDDEGLDCSEAMKIINRVKKEIL
jgi:hypothetical protein